MYFAFRPFKAKPFNNEIPVILGVQTATILHLHFRLRNDDDDDTLPLPTTIVEGTDDVVVKCA